MNIKEIRLKTNMTQREFAEYLNIPQRTIENWEGGQRTPPEYVIELIKYKIEKEILNLLIVNTLNRTHTNILLQYYSVVNKIIRNIELFFN